MDPLSIFQTQALLPLTHRLARESVEPFHGWDQRRVVHPEHTATASKRSVTRCPTRARYVVAPSAVGTRFDALHGRAEADVEAEVSGEVVEVEAVLLCSRA